MPGAVVNHLAVALELCTDDGHARALIHHEAAQQIVFVHAQVGIGHQVAVFVEVGCEGRELALIAFRRNRNQIAALTHIDEAVDFEEARLVGYVHTCHASLRLGIPQRYGIDGVAGDGRAVIQSHIAAHHTCGPAPAICAHAADVLSLAVVHTFHGVGIDVLWSWCLVDIGVDGVGTLQFHLFVRSLVAARDAEEVACACGCPRQHHRCLLGLGRKTIYLYVAVELVAGCFAGLGLGDDDAKRIDRLQPGLAGLHRQTEIVVNTRRNHLKLILAALALVFGQHPALGVSHFAAYRLVDVQHHLRLRVPEGGSMFDGG